MAQANPHPEVSADGCWHNLRLAPELYVSEVADIPEGTLACIVVPLSIGREHGWPAWVFVALAFAAAAIVVFVKYEAWLARNGGMPVVDMAMFQIVSFRRGVLVATLGRP